jgi:hypothetical protein
VSEKLPKPRSKALVDGPQRAPARAMLRASGLRDEDFTRPLIGVANTWIEIGPCNYHLRELAQHVKDGIRAAGGTPLEFNTVSISDGITMGSEGMRASLVSREVIADSIELVTRGNLFDAVIVLVGCDKTIPGGVLALARLDIPGLILYGGSIAPGRFENHSVTIQDVFEAAARTTQADIARLALRTEADDLWVIEQIFVDDNRERHYSQRPTDEGIAGQVMRSGNRVLVGTGLRNVSLDVGYPSWLAVPLELDNLIVGVLSVGSLQADFFKEAQIDFLKNLGSHTIISIQNERLLDELTYQVDVLTNLRELSISLSNQTAPFILASPMTPRRSWITSGRGFRWEAFAPTLGWRWIV